MSLNHTQTLSSLRIKVSHPPTCLQAACDNGVMQRWKKTSYLASNDKHENKGVLKLLHLRFIFLAFRNTTAMQTQEPTQSLNPHPRYKLKTWQPSTWTCGYSLQTRTSTTLKNILTSARLFIFSLFIFSKKDRKLFSRFTVGHLKHSIDFR